MSCFAYPQAQKCKVRYPEHHMNKKAAVSVSDAIAHGFKALAKEKEYVRRKLDDLIMVVLSPALILQQE